MSDIDSQATGLARDGEAHPAPDTGTSSADPPGVSSKAGAPAPLAQAGEPAAAPGAPPPDEEDEPSVIPVGNPLRLVRGGLTALAGGVVAFCIMALDPQFRWGVPLGILATAVASWGVLDLLGSFDDDDEHVAGRVRLADLGRPLAASVACLALTLVFIGLTVEGRLPIAATAVLVPGSFLALVASVFQTGAALGPWRTDENGEPRPLLRRHGFWLVAITTLMFLPMQGSYSLSDPWETHYGEVAREILSRNDWISLWWAQDGWFWSKPILVFWTQALAMGVFGVHYKPGEMMVGAPGAGVQWPEWAVRMPVFVMATVGLYLLYKGVAKVFGRRAGLLGGLVVASCPHWFLLAHQTITDMPLVSTLSASMGLLLLGIHSDPEKRVRAWAVQVGKTSFRLSAFHLVFGVVVWSALPQILYLLSRNVELVWQAGTHGFRPHLDSFMSGSAGNCGLPGNESCTRHLPVVANVQPALQALIWTVLAGLTLWMNWGERRVARLCFLLAWWFAAISTMGKGPLGVVLPMVAAFTYLAATRRWAKLLSLEILSGLLIIAFVALPWYVAMYLRHGSPFTDRLIFHDMFKRALEHVHDTNEGDDTSFRFFVWQLGYAFYLWVGLVPAGLVWWARRRDDTAGGKGDVSIFLAMWFVFAFGLFSVMGTKFHHYIFPAVPPAAMLTGILVDRMLGDGALARPGQLAKYLAATAAGTLVTLYGFIRIFPGQLSGFRADDGTVRAGSFVIGAALVAVGVAIAVAAARLFGRAAEVPADEDDTPRARSLRHENLMLGGIALAAAIVTGLVGRDLAIKPEAGDVVGQARLMHLFTYNYRRPWPDSLDFTGTIAGFTVMATALLVFMLLVRWRRHLTLMFTMTALAWATWGVNVYLVKCAPHWGQREILETYVEKRASADDPFVAYQMNWKGENFYNGNKVPAFVSSGATFTNWMKGQQAKGVKTFYFVTEHGRTGSLKNELGQPKGFELLTDKRVNNKFVLVRATFE